MEETRGGAKRKEDQQKLTFCCRKKPMLKQNAVHNKQCFLNVQEKNGEVGGIYCLVDGKIANEAAPKVLAWITRTPLVQGAPRRVVGSDEVQGSSCNICVKPRTRTRNADHN